VQENVIHRQAIYPKIDYTKKGREGMRLSRVQFSAEIEPLAPFVEETAPMARVTSMQKSP
jgi:hypothetical protein